MASPPDLQRLARLHRARQQHLSGAAVLAVRRLWPSAPWSDIAAVILRLVTGYQREAARGATSYVSTALGLSGATPDPVGVVNESAFAGVASDGRDLPGLLGYPAFEASAFVDEGMDRAQAQAIGGRHLERIVQTQVQDAARVSTGVAITSDRKVSGYVRMLTLPSCPRCVILAGRWYRYDAGFLRHPQCDCISIPAAENVAGDIRTSPKAYFDSLSETEQDKAFTKAGAQAIRDGADINQVVNARRGMYTASIGTLKVKATREGVTSRGEFGRLQSDLRKRKGNRYRTSQTIRIMPEEIYGAADGNRDEAIRLLRKFGYLR